MFRDLETIDMGHLQIGSSRRIHHLLGISLPFGIYSGHIAGQRLTLLEIQLIILIVDC